MCLREPGFRTRCPDFKKLLWQQPLKTSRLSRITRSVRFLLRHGNAPVYRCNASEAARHWTIHPRVGALRMQGRGVCHRKEIVIMRSSTRILGRTLTGVVSVLALAPLLYFAACSSSDDNGGGGGSPPPSNNNTPTGSANQFAYVTSAGTSE